METNTAVMLGDDRHRILTKKLTNRQTKTVDCKNILGGG